MRLSEETITPDAAREWLRNTEGHQQRAISEKAVLRLAAAITEGRWQLTHQPIAITADGVCIDGRHRLSAIVRARRPVRCLVARDADPSTFMAIDTGRGRTPGDILHIAGHTNTAMVAAMVRYVIAATRIRGTQNTWGAVVGPIRHDEILSFADEHRVEIEHACAVGYRIARNLGRYGLRTWLAAVVYIIRESDVPLDVQTEFLDRLSDGANLPPGSPILALRRYVTQSYLQQSNAVRGPVGIGATLKAFNAYVQGRTVNLTVFRLGIERFPGVDRWDPARHAPADHLPLETLPEPTAEAAR